MAHATKQKGQNINKPFNRRGFRANGLSLLPLALRPCLAGLFDVAKEVRGGLARPLLLTSHSSPTPKSRSAFWTSRTSRRAPAIIGGFMFLFLLLETPEASAASLTLTVPATPLSLDLAPGAEPTFAKSNAAQVSITTSNSTGYTFIIEADGGDHGHGGGDNSGGGAGGKSKNILNKVPLNSIPKPVSEESFRSEPQFNNSWGYLPSKLNGLENTKFMPIPINDPIILDITRAANHSIANVYNFTIGAKADHTVPIGRYEQRVIFSVTSNSSTIQAMQDWTGCDALPELEITQLRDARDNAIYDVAKLEDGKCWMTEDLRLGGSEEIELTPENSDISSNFTLPASDNANWRAVHDTAYVYQAEGTEQPDRIYYSWTAATAGTGISNLAEGTDADGSICPKGWRLPKGNPSGEFPTLSNSFALGEESSRHPDGPSSSDLSVLDPNSSNSSSFNPNSSNSSSSDPNSLNSPSSNSDPNSNSSPNLNSSSKLDSGLSIGTKTRYWSSTSYGYTGSFYGAHALSLDEQSATLVYFSPQYNGHSVRCLAR